jgi:hypothetical protein
MDNQFFAGKTFSDIFWDAMRLVFYDEHKNPGLLYQGKLYPFAQNIIALNERRWGFTEKAELAMLKLGDFRYNPDDDSYQFPGITFEGPDEGASANWWAAAYGVYRVDVNFYTILDTPLTGNGFNYTKPPLVFPEDETGLRMITYFTAGTVLHEITHHHGFMHPDHVDWNRGSDYASSLPHVALLTVLSACPEWPLFQPYISGGFPSGAFQCCGTKSPPPAPPIRQNGWRLCRKCAGMFFGWSLVSPKFGDVPLPPFAGTCAAGGLHDQSGSGDYWLATNSPFDPGQPLWRRCNKCACMFYAGHGAGRCPAGGGHDSYASGDYSIMQNVGTSAGQNNWRWCNKCQGLFFGGWSGSGVCPAPSRIRGKHGHDQTGSGDYCVPVVI